MAASEIRKETRAHPMATFLIAYRQLDTYLGTARTVQIEAFSIWIQKVKFSSTNLGFIPYVSLSYDLDSVVNSRLCLVFTTMYA